jgi:hypothetical protein
MQYTRIFLLLSLSFCSLRAQQTNVPSTQEHPIQDNSFLAEEAYNQEPGVVQHIGTFSRLWIAKTWAYTFTQEWPVPNHWRHQLSYTLAGSKGADDLPAGLGDSMVNYRYQLVGDGNSRLAISPRISLIAPTGSSRNALGYGGVGLQSAIPASIVLNKFFVTHADLGGTWIPRARDAAGDKAASYGYNATGSLIWLAKNRVNGMLETSWNSAHVVSRPNGTAVQNTLWIAPGLRWAHNFKSGLQIVPGVAFLAGAGPSFGEKGVFLYLSFEHPMWKEKEK